MEDGVISPGGVGYDVNCTDGETAVLFEHGTYLKIKEMENGVGESQARFLDINGALAYGNAKVVCFMKRPEESHIYEITTRTGKRIKVTGDHPIYTREGMKNADAISTNDSVATTAFNGVPHKEPEKKLMVTKEEIEKILFAKRGKVRGNSIAQIVKDLERRGLLPLTSSHPQFPYLVKTLGYVFGDGSISFVNGKKGTTWFYGKEEDLESIREDIKKIGFTPSKIYKRTRTHRISTYYKKHEFIQVEYSFKVGSTGFAALLTALGTPSGLKATQEYEVPGWLNQSPLWIKRLFLAAFFGAEMSAPATPNKYNFYAPTLGMNKLESLELNAAEFLEQIKALLSDFGVETSPIMKVKEYGTKGKKGVTCGYRIQVSSKPENLKKFFETVSFEYNKEKFKKACLAANYIYLKEKVKEKRKRIRKTAIALYAEGNSPQNICRELCDENANEGFVKHSIWTNYKENPRITPDFMSFSEYQEKYACGDSGASWDEIEKIERIPFDDWVYDITIGNENHNFIANGFIVSNCGMRLLRSDLQADEVKPRAKELVERFYANVPVGVGTKARKTFSKEELGEAVTRGLGWALEQDVGVKKDAEHCEENGCMAGADYSKVSDLAKKRGKPQLGTLGSGNHFLELQRVAQVFDDEKARAFGLFEGQATVMIHSGSRGYGHQICSDYIRVMLDASRKYGIHLADPELCCAPINSQEARDYVGAMASAVNYAFLNRLFMAHWVRQSFEQVLGGDWETHGLHSIYDVCHNIAKFEEHGGKKLCVHRKGATRAFWAGREEVPADYRSIGQPVIIPGSMQTASYVLCGLEGAKESWGTVCHGAGRVMSRHAAIQSFDSNALVKNMHSRSIEVKAKDARTLSEEAGGAYKNVDDVVESVERAGLAKIVARLEPLGVIKG